MQPIVSVQRTVATLFQEEKQEELLQHQKIQRGSLSFFLPTNKTWKMVVQSKVFGVQTYQWDLPVNIPALPVGTERFPLMSVLRKSFEKPMCFYFSNRIRTFSQAGYKFEIPNKSCEYILFDTRPGTSLPKMTVTTKQVGTLRQLRWMVGDSELLIQPTEWNRRSNIMVRPCYPS